MTEFRKETHAMPQKVVDINEGIAWVVTDLHGDWDAYARYRDGFFEAFQKGAAQHLIFCGDIIHHNEPTLDRSLEILQDLMLLQKTYGTSTLLLLLGNHEFPHIYGIPLLRSDQVCTLYLDTVLAKLQPPELASLLRFLNSLPFCVRTKAGVMITHAGAHPDSAILKNCETLSNLDHQALLRKVEAQMDKIGRKQLIKDYEATIIVTYDRIAEYFFQITSRDDPRYYYLARSRLLNEEHEFTLLWNALFTSNEKEMGELWYPPTLGKFLYTWSQDALYPQKFLVTGHIEAEGGYAVIADKQLRVASHTHALPSPEHGKYLVFDCGAEATMRKLVAGIKKIG